MRGLGHILGGFTRHGSVDALASHPAGHSGKRASDLVYPPVDPGFPASSVEELLGPHQELIDRIKMCYGVDRATFEHELLVLIRRYADFVHLLPATLDNYFNAPGGLLRMCWEPQGVP